MAKWMLRQTTSDIANITRQAGIHPVLGRILAVRGYRSAAEINAFLQADKLNFFDPFAFADMDKAVYFTQKALEEKKKIAIFGDYDADGIMSTVILYFTLKELDADVTYYIPNREEEGYGLNKEALLQLRNRGITLVIACDNGISAFEEVRFAETLGMGIIILDHHDVMNENGADMPQCLPEALAVVDPQRADCNYPYSHYCAAGICYRFSQALYLSLKKDWQQLSETCLPFAAIATICDLVELTGENRKLVKNGLPQIAKSTNPGLRALIEATGLRDKELDTYHIGFILGPCINASGRLDVADTAVELFITSHEATAKKIAAGLVELNMRRRKMTEGGAALAFQIIEENALYQDKIIVLHSDEFRESVAGIIAGKVKEKYHRPAIIIGGDKDILHGSGRSIEAYNIFEGLVSCREYLLSFGGHPLAAGLSIERDKVPAFARRINEQCALEPDDLQALFRIDCPMPPSQASLVLAKELSALMPYGKGNPMPLFAYKDLSVEKITLLGKEEQVMRWLLKEDTGRIAEVIDFCDIEALKAYVETAFDENCWKKLLAGRKKNTVKLDIIYTLQVNMYNGNESVRLQVVDFRPAR